MIFQSTEDREIIIKLILHNVKLTEEQLAKFREIIKQSFCIHIGWIKDEIACIWGLMTTSLLSEQAYMWLHTTEIVQDHTITFIRGSRCIVKIALEDFPSIIGECVVGNDRGMAWLRWLGAEFGESNGQHIPFIIRRP